MTVKRIFETPKLIGLSTDDKLNDALVGTELYTYDDKLTWVVIDKIAGVSQWTLKS